VLIATVYKGLSTQWISNNQKISSNDVKALQYRALANLRKQLDKDTAEDVEALRKQTALY
jgi:DNA-directed RNA polymerase specialized sigma24 family protein